MTGYNIYGREDHPIGYGSNPGDGLFILDPPVEDSRPKIIRDLERGISENLKERRVDHRHEGLKH